MLSRWRLELADNKPLVPVSKGALLESAGAVPMVGTGMGHQNQPVLQTTSSSA